MPELQCLNPACSKKFYVSTEKDDRFMGTCSFECWEAVYCKTPQISETDTEWTSLSLLEIVNS